MVVVELVNLIIRGSMAWANFMLQEIIYSLILFLMISPLLFLFRNRSPYWCFGLWMLIFVRLILPVDFALSTSLWNVLNLNELNFPSQRLLDQSSIVVNDGLAITVDSQNPLAGLSLKTCSDSSVFKRASVIIFFLWLLGISSASMIYFRKRRSFQSIIKKAEGVGEGRLIRIAEFWRRRLKIRRQIRISTSHEYSSAFTMGIFKPKIFIPKIMLEARNYQLLHSVIGHEIVHIKRFDHLWIRLQSFIQIAFFFHPLVWIGGRTINQARERICDALVLKEKVISPAQYAHAVIQALHFNSLGYLQANLFPAFQGTQRDLKKRINTILEDRQLKNQQLILTFSMIGLLGLLTLPMASVTNTEKMENIFSSSQSHDHFLIPLKNGLITSRFGERLHPFKKIRMHHNGIDIAAPEGTEVLASREGTVVFAQFQEDWGNKIIIEHENSFSTIYGQLLEIKVHLGEKVNAGQLIGLVGSTGSSTAPHLHFELRVTDLPQNPEDYIDFTHLKQLGE